MANRLILCIGLCVLGLAAACGRQEVRSDGVALSEADAIAARRDFNSAVVGQNLRGQGFDLTVAEGGVLIGTHLGQPFVGSWEFRRGVFCTSLRGESVREASDRACYRVVTDGREVTFSAVPPAVQS